MGWRTVTKTVWVCSCETEYSTEQPFKCYFCGKPLCSACMWVLEPRYLTEEDEKKAKFLCEACVDKLIALSKEVFKNEKSFSSNV